MLESQMTPTTNTPLVNRNISRLPRLLYIGDVPVESTVAGSALLYRLLQNYPTDKLYIIESNTLKSNPNKRLPNVTYKTVPLGSRRLLQSRFVEAYTSYIFLTARWRSQQLVKVVKTFKPNAILTVAHGLSWLTAAALARRFKVPLHLIIHDDLPSYIPVVPWLQNAFNRKFGNIYQQAQSRFCVSPYMVESYHKRYGVTGSVIYPSRAADIYEFGCPPKKNNSSSKALVFAYAGSVNSQGQADTLISLASVLEILGGRLIIYSGLTQESANKIGLSHQNIDMRSLIPYKKLVSTLREEADVLFLPMNFDSDRKSNMQLCFPSKLTDYTATGLPLLVWGPHYCSAVRWAKDNPGVAEVVDQDSLEALVIAVKKLAQDTEYRFNLGQNAIDIGREYFAHARVTEKFYDGL